MAANPVISLRYGAGCPDCGQREVALPKALARPGDDFDWDVRDYDGFRLFMLQELSARFPERLRWTPADVEVAVIEVLSAVLDQLSDAQDRIAAEAYLETARQPSSVRRLLSLIGYDAVARSGADASIPDNTPADNENMQQRRDRLMGFCLALHSYFNVYEQIAINGGSMPAIQAFMNDPESADAASLLAVQRFLDAAPEFVQRARADALDSYWFSHPLDMDQHRLAGPRHIHDQQRMVSIEDYANHLAAHPLVNRATAWGDWSGSWHTVNVAVAAWQNYLLDEAISIDEVMRADVDAFHNENGLPEVNWGDSDGSDLRLILMIVVNAWRMAGQAVQLHDPHPVGISMSVSVQVEDNYFQSEIRAAIEAVLGTGISGFFAAGNLQFGEDLHVSDIYELLMALDGVKAVCLNRFKRVGSQFPDASESGVIELNGLEIAVCDQDAAHPENGYYRLRMHGGKKG
ncbi:hypothetical protein JYT48_01985 [Mariprofundus ferrooxydans]|nr:hypothetical protein [Mariprofundus ferrooxydans]